jgi:DNA-binding MarR family transcriptional regulator
MGVTVAALESRGLLTRAPDPDDGRRSLLSPTPDGVRLVRDARNSVSERIAAALEEHFSAEDVSFIRAAAPMIEHLAHLI